MKYILGRKIEMTQRYRPGGEAVAVTLVKVEPCVVTQVKTVERDGYAAVQIGTGTRKALSKPELGHRGGLGPVGLLREFRVASVEGVQVGARCEAAAFASGDAIDVTGVSKGKGFQGVVKRHGFAGGPATHGQKDQLRMPGSIGGGGRNGKGRVVKGMRMAGRMGGDRVTVKNLEVVEVLADQGILAVKGAVPGARGALLLIAGPGEMAFTAPAAPAAQEAPVQAEAPAPEEKAEAAAA